MKTYKDLFEKIEKTSMELFNIHREITENFSEGELCHVLQILRVSWYLLDSLFMTDFAKKENLEKCLPLPDEDELPF